MVLPGVNFVAVAAFQFKAQENVGAVTVHITPNVPHTVVFHVKVLFQPIV